MYADCAVTVPVGEISEENKKLLEVTRQALFAGIKACVSGNYVNDISKAIEKSIPKKYGIVKILSGHGVGYKPHEDPYVPNFDDGTRGPKLVPGMVLALEPMVNLGTDDVELMD
jgi:methionyl aminopeptidase